MKKKGGKIIQVNYYEHLPKELVKQYHNPGYERHNIQIPFRMCIAGPPGSGKTNTLLQLIHLMTDTFNKIVICTKNKNEPLYDFLEMKIPKDSLSFYEGYENIPKQEDLKAEPNDQILVVFDDMVNEKDQSKIIDYFIRARKSYGGISCIYISQSYYGIPKKIRTSLDYILLKRLSTLKDLNLILAEYNFGENKKEVVKKYKKATERGVDFFLIDVLPNTDESHRYRKNFDIYFT